MKWFIANWKTNALGIGGLFTALGALVTSLASGDTTHLFAEMSAVVTAAGVIFARDAAKP